MTQSTSVTDLVERVDIDQDDFIQRKEACSVLIGRHNCVDNYEEIHELNWYVDFNLDKYISF